MARPKLHTEAAVHFGKQTRVKYVYGELLVKTDADDYITTALNGVIARSSDLRIPFQQFQPFWMGQVAQTFEDEGDPAWAPLSDAYAAWKNTVAPGRKMLDFSGAMQDSLISQTSDTIWKVTPHTIQFGSRVPYFIYHQEGLGKNPRRPMLDLSAISAAKLNDLVLRHVHGSG